MIFAGTVTSGAATVFCASSSLERNAFWPAHAVARKATAASVNDSERIMVSTSDGGYGEQDAVSRAV